MALANQAAAASDWQRENLFKIDEATEHLLKCELARTLGIRYATINPAKAFASAVAGVAQYDPDRVKQMFDAPPSPTASTAITCTVHACLISWKTCGVQNVNYIMNSCTKYLNQWDSTIDRKASGWQPAVAPEAQSLTCTNMSSLLRLIAEACHFLGVSKE